MMSDLKNSSYMLIYGLQLPAGTSIVAGAVFGIRTHAKLTTQSFNERQHLSRLLLNSLHHV